MEDPTLAPRVAWVTFGRPHPVTSRPGAGRLGHAQANGRLGRANRGWPCGIRGALDFLRNCPRMDVAHAPINVLVAAVQLALSRSGARTQPSPPISWQYTTPEVPHLTIFCRMRSRSIGARCWTTKRRRLRSTCSFTPTPGHFWCILALCQAVSQPETLLVPGK